MSRVYLDSMVWIYALESHPQFGVQAQLRLKALREARYTILASHFLLGELLVAPVKKQDAFMLASYRKTFHAREIELVRFSDRAAIALATIRAQFKVSPADAVHLAAATVGGADYFVTTDARLLRLSVAGIGHIVDLSYPIG